MICKDHEGTEYPSMMRMAVAWGLPYHVLWRRIDEGWDIERALTERVERKARRGLVDLDWLAKLEMDDDGD